MYMEVGEMNRTLKEVLNELRAIHSILQRHGNPGCQNSGVGCQTKQSPQNNA